MQAEHIPVDEWESISFPLVLSNLRFENDSHYLPADTTIEIWRNEGYKLVGKMYGSDFYSHTVDRVSYVGKGHIIKNENLIGYDGEGNKWTVINCLVGNLIRQVFKTAEKNYPQSAYMHFDFVKFNSHIAEGSKPTKRFEWFLTGKIDTLFEGSTIRQDEPRIKARASIDEYENIIDYRRGHSMSRDYTVLNWDQGECIIAQIPERCLPDNVHGICFEFRGENIDIISSEMIKDLKYFVSFLFGSKLCYTGYTILSDRNILERFLASPRLERNMRGDQPPVPFSFHHEWSQLRYLTKMLFPKYISRQKTLQLNQAISRYWTAQHTSVGLNLPILANALEVVASNYLKMTGNDDLNYTTEDQYIDVLGAEFDVIKSRLLTLKDGHIIVNKILGDFRKGPAEKMRKFFSLLELKIGTDEKNALILRNKMAHGARDYSDDDRAYDDLYLSHIYEMLFNRAILRILGYTEFYRDYSQVGLPVKHIKLAAGAK